MGEQSVFRSPLGRRLLAAFLLVALSSVLMLTVAALVATDRGLTGALRADQEKIAGRAGTAIATAYAAAGGWPGIDLDHASDIAEAAGARLVVFDMTGAMVWPGHGMGGRAMQSTVSAHTVQSPVEVDGARVGTARVSFPANSSAARQIAWSWVAGAAGVALLAALLVSGFVTRRLTRPLVRAATAARRFAAGERDARSGVDAPGEVGEVIRAFDAMADEVVRTDVVRRRLAADVAHELRTPLAALQAGLEELRDGLSTPDAERLGVLHDQALRLGRVVADLADLSAAESAALSLRPIDTDLTRIARAALDAERPHLDAAGLRVGANLQVALPVHADPDRLHQSVTNLLTNAARYCRPGDRVTITGRVDGAEAMLAVADTGPGIAAEDLPHVFDRLWRAERNRDVAGSGIGLAIVRELISAHGGTVTAASGVDAGTVITVRLPLASSRCGTIGRPTP
ncbi:sensor histidine kinase [Actinoplanes solisilvae]|uniref:sensor histidine kinase n=1 Tax=Actinoplanes solisilvae TaxID=2486853 RepID=UPI000FDBA2B2|nr:HAMP domain-containing sensor histidine kinase [Actinoplanes solisilvae]